MAFGFILGEKANHSVRRMCRLLGVSPSGLYAWCTRSKSERAIEDEVLTETIREVHARSRRTYGAPRVHAELTLGLGMRIGRKRVARLMRHAGIRGAYRPRKRRTTLADRNTAPHPDHVLREFSAPAPDRLWVADITYVPTGESFFATLEKELLDLTRFKTRAQARRAIFDYIEIFYNRQRRHSMIGNVSPEEFERKWREAVESELQGASVA